jgi:hypothetical protein
MKTINLRLNGVSPGLLTHNERLASKLDPIARELSAISSKRKKTDDDLAEMARLEFIGGLYVTDDGLVGLPAWNVFKSLQEGARLNKLGKAVERAVLPIGRDVLPIKHDGPNTAEAMWAAGCFDQRSVKVSTSKVTRTRPHFTNWSLDATFAVDTEILRFDEFELIAYNAGRLVGVGDYRPRFGRFDVEITEVTA